MPSSRRDFVLGVCASTLVAAVARPLVAAGTPVPVIAVTKSPSCGCCGDWVDHLRANGFAVTIRDVVDVAPEKRRLGVPKALESCHTALVEGYVVEGHVPAADVKRLLREQSAGVIGLAVPGMPVGSPGMEVGDRKEPFQVVAWTADSTRIFSRY